MKKNGKMRFENPDGSKIAADVRYRGEYPDFHDAPTLDMFYKADRVSSMDEYGRVWVIKDRYSLKRTPHSIRSVLR